MIYVTHTRPDGSPARLECGDCHQVWTADPDDLPRNVLFDLMAFSRTHMRRFGGVAAPATSLAGVGDPTEPAA